MFLSLERYIYKPYSIEYSMGKTSSSIYNINYHFVWCPKYRKQILKKEIKEFTEETLRTICLSKGWELLEIEVMPDHIHLFISAPPYESPTGIIKVLKGTSAIRIFKQFSELRKDLRKGHVWSPSYYVGTAGKVTEETIRRYIQEQEKGASNSSTQ